MGIIIYTINSEIGSAKKLAKKLGASVHTYLFDPVDSFNEDIVIRFGNSTLSHILEPIKDKPIKKKSFLGKILFPYALEMPERKYVEFKNVINGSKSIILNCDKLKALKELSKVVNVPTIYEKEMPKDKWILLRSKTHTAGKNFVVHRGPFSLIDRDWYGTEFIKTNYEYRVFFCNDKTMMVRRVNGKRKRDRSAFKCRSLYHYGKFQETPKDLHDMVLKAAKQIGLSFGCADVLYLNGRYYFCELNSSPSLDSPQILTFYKNGLKQILWKKFGYKEEKLKVEDIKELWAQND